MFQNAWALLLFSTGDLNTISYIPGDNEDVPYELAPAVSDYETPVVRTCAWQQ